MQNFSWLCEMRGLIHNKSNGSPTYAGGYMVVYFDDFKVLAVRKNNTWILTNKTFPLSYQGGAYGMAKAIGL